MKKYIAFLLTALLLCGCSENPTSERTAEAATEAVETTAATEAQPAVCYTDAFTTADGGIQFVLNAEDPGISDQGTIYESSLHYMTGEEARAAAEALFGSSDGFEQDPWLVPLYTKKDIDESIRRWSAYMEPQAVEELLGEADDFVIEVVSQKVEELKASYDAAPDENPRQKCDWQFKNRAYYVYEPEIAATDTNYPEMAIQARIEHNGIPYDYNVWVNEQGDVRQSTISAYIASGSSPLSIDEAIYRSRLCRTEEPTLGQKNAVKDKVSAMLRDMNVGDWQIEEVRLLTTGEEHIPEHQLVVTAVPVLCGERVLSPSQNFGSNFVQPSATFNLSADGSLLYFQLESPLESVRAVSENEDLLPLTDLLEIGKENLVKGNMENFPDPDYLSFTGLEFDRKVEINAMETGLVRQPGTADAIRFVPGLMLRGTVTYIEKDSGEPYHTAENLPLLTLNAIDGTVIQ